MQLNILIIAALMSMARGDRNTSKDLAQRDIRDVPPNPDTPDVGLVAKMPALNTMHYEQTSSTSEAKICVCRSEEESSSKPPSGTSKIEICVCRSEEESSPKPPSDDTKSANSLPVIAESKRYPPPPLPVLPVPPNMQERDMNIPSCTKVFSETAPDMSSLLDDSKVQERLAQDLTSESVMKDDGLSKDVAAKRDYTVVFGSDSTYAVKPSKTVSITARQLNGFHPLTSKYTIPPSMTRPLAKGESSYLMSIASQDIKSANILSAQADGLSRVGLTQDASSARSTQTSLLQAASSLGARASGTAKSEGVSVNWSSTQTIKGAAFALAGAFGLAVIL